MARPVKKRRVCSLPERKKFGPLDSVAGNQEQIIMTVDEYEVIRLIDLEGYTQAECAEQMDVARTTIQGIYRDARIKLAQVLVEGKTLSIQGGEYQICGEAGQKYGRGRRRRYGRRCSQDMKG